MSFPRRIVLTVGPGAGKTTLLEELARRGFRIVPEAARAVLQVRGGLKLRADDPDGFAEAILARELARFDCVEADSETAFYDRGLGDLAAMPVSSERLRHRIAQAVSDYRYEGPVFRAPAWQAIYRRDSERTQTWEEAIVSDMAVTASWRAAGYEVVDLPLATPQERVSFVLERL